MSETITVNGETRPWRRQTMDQLLAEDGVAAAGTAVAVNAAVVPRGAWSQTPVAPGDRIEIVKIVRGG